MEIVTQTRPDPAHACDVEAATGLPRTAIESAIRAERRISSHDQVSWPRDPFGVARDLVWQECTGQFRPVQDARRTATQQLGEALVEARRRRAEENANAIDASRRVAAAIVANGRSDALASAVAAQARYERTASNAAVGLEV